MRFPWNAKPQTEVDELVEEQARGMSPAAARQLRDAVTAATREPPRIAVIGQAGVGKTTSIIKLFNVNSSALRVSHVLRGTHEPVEQDIATPRGHITIVDMPGLGETLDVDNVMLAHYARILPTVDVALWVLLANRNQAPSQAYLNYIRGMLAPNVFSRIVFGLNKVDLMQPGKWLDRVNLPDSKMRASIAELTRWLQGVFQVEASRIVAYSAEKQYNLDGLRNAMLEAVPRKRLLALDKRADPANPTSGMSRDYREQTQRILREVGL